MGYEERKKGKEHKLLFAMRSNDFIKYHSNAKVPNKRKVRMMLINSLCMKETILEQLGQISDNAKIHQRTDIICFTLR